MDLTEFGEHFWSHRSAEADDEVRKLALRIGILELQGFKYTVLENGERCPAFELMRNWCNALELPLTDAACLFVSVLCDRVGFIVAWAHAIKYRYVADGCEGNVVAMDWVLGLFGDTFAVPSEIELLEACSMLKNSNKVAA